MTETKDRRPAFDSLRDFYTKDEVRQWLDKPHPQLGGESAFYFICRTKDFEAVHKIIDRLENGVYL